ncbi:MAG: DUF4168 domain-containing protein [Cyanobacteria bacterium J06598_3]
MKLRRYSQLGLAIALGAFTFTALNSSPLRQTQVSQTLVPAAQAQALTDTDVANYARAVVDIEEIRLSAYEAASDILTSAGSETDILETPLSCDAARMVNMPDIPRVDRLDLLTVLVEFCNSAAQLADDNGLTQKRFNSITAAHQEDADLAERIQAEISSL